MKTPHHYMHHVRIEYLRKRALEAVRGEKGYWRLYFEKFDAVNRQFALRQFLGAFDYLGKFVYVRNATTVQGVPFSGKIFVNAVEQSQDLGSALFIFHGILSPCPLAPKHPNTPVTLYIQEKTIIQCAPTKTLR